MFKHADNQLVWKHVKSVRSRFYQYLLTLQPEQWNEPSLCKGWRVRDVVAHVTILYQYSPRHFVSTLASSGLNVNRLLHKTAVDFGRLSTRQLLEQYKLTIDHQKIPYFVPPLNALADALVHEQDIRMALGDHNAIPDDLLVLIFSHWQPGHYNIGERITGIKKRTRGICFIADDIDMKYGDGLVVRGTAQDVLMAIAGRPLVLGRLRGEGHALLTSRLVF